MVLNLAKAEQYLQPDLQKARNIWNQMSCETIPVWLISGTLEYNCIRAPCVLTFVLNQRYSGVVHSKKKLYWEPNPHIYGKYFRHIFGPLFKYRYRNPLQESFF